MMPLLEFIVYILAAAATAVFAINLYMMCHHTRDFYDDMMKWEHNLQAAIAKARIDRIADTVTAHRKLWPTDKARRALERKVKS
jgi:hypothetical protein